MNSLDDLVRETLAERAHDVDHVQLNAPAARPARARRWVAVGTVVAVAAAILVAVVLVAPWRGATHRTATPADFTGPPAGMQWVSYRGITLTVPDFWQTGPLFCSAPRSDAVVIGDGFEPACPLQPAQPTTPSDAVVVRLSPLGDATAQGESIELDGRPARRFVSDGGPGVRAQLQFQLPTVGVSLIIDSPDLDDGGVLASLRYTPIDHYGCATTPPPGEAAPPSGTVDIPDDPRRVVVCEYDGGGSDDRLMGSRVLTSSETGALRTVLDTATPLTTPVEVGRFGSDQGLHVFRYDDSDGSTTTIVVDLTRRPVTVWDGSHRASLPGGVDSAAPALPNAYP